MIIGITGFLASGKGAVSDILKEKGFIIYSCSDEIRDFCKKKNIELTRDNLQKIGNDLRKEHGPDYLSKRIVEKIILNGLDKNYVVESIRTLGEIEELKKLPNFTLVFIDADSKIRYKRAKERLKEKEHIDSYEDFMASENKELSSNDLFSQNLLGCKKKAAFIINNDRTLEDLKKETEDTLLKIQILNRNKPDWDNYFLKIAEIISKRSSCLSVDMGCVIVKDNVIKSTGYVGSPRGTKDCFEKGYCLRRKLNIESGKQYELCASVHAEQNAIINAARDGKSITDSTMYIVGKKKYLGIEKNLDSFPCFICKKMIINAGIKKVVCRTEDGNHKTFIVDDWIDYWKKNDIINDKEKYSTKY